MSTLQLKLHLIFLKEKADVSRNVAVGMTGDGAKGGNIIA